MSHDPTFVAIIERNIHYFIGKVAAANGNARQFLQRERENIFDAVKFAARIPQTNHAAAQLLVEISHLVEQNDSPSQWSQAFIWVLNRYQADDARAICQLYNRLGRFSRQAGQYRRSIKIYRKSLEVATQHQNRFEMANAECGLGMNYLWLTQLDNASRHAVSAEKLLQTMQDDAPHLWRTRGQVANILALIAMNEKRFDAAIEAFDQAIDSLQRGDDAHFAGLVQVNKARVLVAQEQFDQAIALTTQIIDQFERTGAWLSACDAKMALGNIYFWQEQWQDALDMYESVSVHELRKRGHDKHCARLHNNMGNALYYLGRYDAAQRHFAEAISIYRGDELSPELAAAHAMLATTLAALGHRKRARDAIADAEEQLARFQETLFIEDVYADLAEARRLLKRKRLT